MNGLYILSHCLSSFPNSQTRDWKCLPAPRTHSALFIRSLRSCGAASGGDGEEEEGGAWPGLLLQVPDFGWCAGARCPGLAPAPRSPCPGGPHGLVASVRLPDAAAAAAWLLSRAAVLRSGLWRRRVAAQNSACPPGRMSPGRACPRPASEAPPPGSSSPATAATGHPLLAATVAHCHPAGTALPG